MTTITDTSTMTLEDAIILATNLHAGQRDKQNKPYILHPLRVMGAAPSHLQIPAVLHDVMEDCDISAEVLGVLVGNPRTMLILDCLTHRKGETRRAYIGRICGHPEAVILKVLDIQDNLNRVWGLEDPTRQRLLSKYGEDLHQIVAAGYDATTGLRS
jgi:guanosine-3',5'-bis(diphosphate) 3'-pyrophosphohydrolase